MTFGISPTERSIMSSKLRGRQGLAASIKFSLGEFIISVGPFGSTARLFVINIVILDAGQNKLNRHRFRTTLVWTN